MEKENPANDLGLGTKTGSKRSLNRDGSFNVKRIGSGRLRGFEIYHKLIHISWPRFFALLFLSYFAVNLVFAILYYFIGTEHLRGIEGSTSWERFLDTFFFSSQTLTTVGYGRISPVGSTSSSLAAIEAMLGLLGFALATGLLYGRFSKPESRILFSKKALISPFKGGKALMFRIANQRSNQLIEVQADLVISFKTEGPNREFFPAKLERNKINFFPLSWTLVHPIDEESPLRSLASEDYRSKEIEVFILIKAFEETFSQTVYSRHSYFCEEIIHGAKFISIIGIDDNGTRTLNVNDIDKYEEVSFQNNKDRE